ncbi:Sll7028 protein [hydrothermal vent metagenome]|uniref:Sll7028 protein n=1 Tax=hydrothermal vent metagenome TaxID=652676 RepID=A0A1W1CLF3_9ZZZZ
MNKNIEIIGENVIDNTKISVDIDEVIARLTKARAQLILDKPFLGNLVMHLPLVPAKKWCKTTATDAKSFYFNPEYITDLSPKQIKFVLIHEALHCALTHFARRAKREKHRWDLACDFAINPLLIDEGFVPPTNTIMFFEYKGMIAEEIYPLIDDKLDNEPIDQHLYDDKGNGNGGDNSSTTEEKLQNHQQESSNLDKNNNSRNTQNNLADKPPSLSHDEIESLASQWQKNLASSAQLAKQSGKLDGKWSKLVGLFLEPRVSWRSLLAQYMSNTARDDFSYARASRRSQDAIMPSLHSTQINIAIALDTSGSIAGTDFNAVFDKLKTLDINIDLLVYFTDAKGIFPKYPPNFSVVWLVKGSEPVKWGQRVQLN